MAEDDPGELLEAVPEDWLMRRRWNWNGNARLKERQEKRKLQEKKMKKFTMEGLTEAIAP